MAGTTSARRFTEKDKARVFASLAANGGIIKRTARECDVPPATIRRWRGQWERGEPPSKELVTQAVTDFLVGAERVRNSALALLEAKIASGDIKPSELVATIGVLDDKITRAKGLPSQTVEHTHILPPADQLREVMAGVVAGAIAAAERRGDEIIDAEVVEVAALPEIT